MPPAAAIVITVQQSTSKPTIWLSGLQPTWLKQLQAADPYEWQNLAGPTPWLTEPFVCDVDPKWKVQSLGNHGEMRQQRCEWRTTWLQPWMADTDSAWQDQHGRSSASLQHQAAKGVLDPHSYCRWVNTEVILASEKLMEEQPLKSTHLSKWGKTVTVSLGPHLIATPTDSWEAWQGEWIFVMPLTFPIECEA